MLPIPSSKVNARGIHEGNRVGERKSLSLDLLLFSLLVFYLGHILNEYIQDASVAKREGFKMGHKVEGL